MKKRWVLLLLIVILSAQLMLFSSFHYTGADGIATNYTVITVAKFSYVDARVDMAIMPIVTNGTAEATLTMPNGTTIELNGGIFYFGTSLPSSGYTLGSESIMGPINLSPSQPMEVLIQGNVGDVAQYERSLSTVANGGDVQIYFYVIHGNAMVQVEGYGVGL